MKTQNNDVKKAVVLLVPVVLISVLIGCASIPGYMMTQIKTDVSKPFLIYKQNQTKKMGIGSHISMMEVNPNRLMITYQHVGEHSGRPAIMPWPMFTDDKGATWKTGDPYTWAGDYTDNKKPVFVDVGERSVKTWYGYGMSSFSVPPSTRYGFAYMAPLNHRSAVVRDPYFWMIRSEDDGMTWSLPEKSTFIMPTNVLHERESFLKMSSPAAVTSDGSIYMVTYGRIQKNSKHETLLFKSNDQGKTFNYVSTVARLKDAMYSKRAHGPCEGALLALSDTEFICIMRTGNLAGTAGISVNAECDYMVIARSEDAGLTWKRKRLPIKGAMPRLRKLSNGVLVLGTGRPANRLYFSVNGGRNWGGEITLSPVGKVMTSGGMDFREVKPGTLLVVYDVINAPLDRAFAENPKKRFSFKKVGSALYDVLIGTDEEWEDNNYNQILGRYISVKRR